MAKELPYFQFEPGAWDNGNIQMCSRESKGLFIDLCSIYWSRLGELPYALALQKLCNGNDAALKELQDHQIFGVTEGQIRIEFLDEQLSEFRETGEKRRNAANKRWDDARALQKQSKSNAIREEERRGEKKKKDNKKEEKKSVADKSATLTVEERAKIFYDRVKTHLEKYTAPMLRDFYDYWTERNEGAKKMRFELQKIFDLEKRLKTWHRLDQKKMPGMPLGKVKPTLKEIESAV